MWLDPQQRKILEVCYESLESAGLTLDAISGTNTAVFAGCFTSDFQQMSIHEQDFRHNYAATGVDVGIISNRIGNIFNLTGPSFTVNTACSSSVYAIHNACHALRAGDCSAAIVGGVNLVLTVDQHMNTAKLGVMSPTSTCHTFDDSADGYGRAEGAGALYLKRFSDAIRDGDVIRSVIRSSATNTNGKVEGMGITYPSMQGQERCVRQAYRRAGLDPSKTAYAECHGTGTPVGDPIEARAISKALNDARPADQPLILGAVKANIGHSEAASGIFAAMKVSLVVENGVIPGVCGFQKLNKAIKDKEWNILISAENLEWPAGFESRRASLSSFGYGGTNAHLVLENVEALCPWYEHGKPKAVAGYTYDTTRPFLITMSAHNRKTLERNIEAHQPQVGVYFVPDLAYTLNCRRSRFAHSAFTVTYEGEQTRMFDVSAFKFGINTGKPLKLAFVFTGQGAQWSRMGCECLQHFPAFVSTIDALDQVLQRVEPRPEWSLREILEAPESNSRINEAEISQPVCTAIQIAMTDLFASWNIEPSVTIGHSSGEIGAAYAAGRIAAPAAILAAYFRGLAVKAAAPVGTMLAVGVGAAEATERIPSVYLDQVTVACENAPSSTTLSGTSEAIEAVKASCKIAGIFARELKTGKAYHSPHMNAVAPLYTELYSKALDRLVLKDLGWRRPPGPMVSSVTATEHPDLDISIEYWCENLRGRVRFDSAMQYLGSAEQFAEITTLVEVGPHSALGGPIKGICASYGFGHLSYVPSLIRGKDGCTSLLTAAGQLYTQGLDLDWAAVNAMPGSPSTNNSKKFSPRYVPDLPSYQWTYERKYWAEPRTSQENRKRKYMRHDILGTKIAGISPNAATWRNVFRQGDVPWLKDHRLGDANVFPAAGHLSLAIEAYLQQLDLGIDDVAGINFRDINIKTALIVPEDDEGVEIHTRLSKIQTDDGSQSFRFAIETVTGTTWTLHTEGMISQSVKEDSLGLTRKMQSLHRCTQPKRWYDAFHRVGFYYGPSFQTMGPVRSNGRDRAAVAPVKVQQESGMMIEESRYALHPSTIDGCLHVAITSIHKGNHKQMLWGVVPLTIEEVNLNFPSDQDINVDGECLAWTDDMLGGRYYMTDVYLKGASGRQLMNIKNLKVVKYDAAIPQAAAAADLAAPFSTLSWQPNIFDVSEKQAESMFSKLPKNEAIAKAIGLMDHKYGLRRILLLTTDLDADFNDAVKASLPPGAKLTTGLSRAKDSQAPDEASNSDDDIVVITTLDELKSTLIADLDFIVIHDSFKIRDADSEVINLIEKASHGVCDIAVLDQYTYTLDLKRVEWYADLPHCQFQVHLANDTIQLSIIREIRDRADSADGMVYKTAIVTAGSINDVSKSIATYFPKEDIVATEVTMDTNLEVEKFDYFIINDCLGEVLSKPSSISFDILKQILFSEKRVVWLTKGVHQAQEIAGGMVPGFLRAVRNEMVSSKSRSNVIHIDADKEVDDETLMTYITKQFDVQTIRGHEFEKEFWLQRDGIVHIPRIVDSDVLNHSKAQDGETHYALLNTDHNFQGKLVDNMVVFEVTKNTHEPLQPGEVEVQVDCAEMPKADLKAPNNESRVVIGTIVASGSENDAGYVGMTVIAYTDKAFATRIRTKAFCVYEDIERPDVLKNFPSLCRAVDCVIKTGMASPGDHVLVLEAKQDFVKSVIALGRIFDFTVTTPPNSLQELRDILTCSSGSPSLVVSQSTTWLEEAWHSMPSRSRFVLCDKQYEGSLEAGPFARGVSFQVCDVSMRITQDPHSISAAMETSMELLANKNVELSPSAIPVEVDMLEDVEGLRNTQADQTTNVLHYAYGHKDVRVSRKAAESFAEVELILSKTTGWHNATVFSPDGAYLLVGCLGGLGRSLTAYMLSRGCKDFVFLSRSGTDKPEAAAVVENLETAGASVEIFRVDASDEAAVADAVVSITSRRPIRGVIHAAMVLKDGMFENMTLQNYLDCVKPKMLGAINLHKALENASLDFFVMTSSISAVIGNPGQANYCAANGFLDSLALYRRQRGLAASSAALPMVLDVGVVAEHPEIEASLNLKGLYGIDESEMLAAFEVAMQQGPPKPGDENQLARAQIILGLEPAALAPALTEVDEVDKSWSEDARFNLVLAKVEAMTAGSGSSAAKKGGFVAELAGMSEAQMAKTIGMHIIQRVARILMLPVETFDFQQHSVASYGVDSMIGVELRTWLFKEFGYEIGFQKLLDANMTFGSLSKLIVEHLGTSK